MNFEMMESLKFTPVEMTMSYGVIAAPWCIKPAFGLISDKFQIIDWGKRRPYIFCCGVLLGYLYIMLPKFIVTKTSMVATMTLISFLMCFADVCADCITVDYAKKEEVKGKTQGNCWTSRALGSVIGSALGGTTYQHFGTKTVFQIMALPCVIMAFNIWKLDINTATAPENICKKLWKAVYKKRVLAFSIFALSIGPNYGPFYTYYLRRELKFKPEDFQWITMSSACAFLASTFTYKTFLLNVPPLKLMRISIYCGVFCQLVQLLVVTNVSGSIWLIVFDTIGESLFGMWIMMPVIVIIAHNAKSGVEGTFYALLMAVSNMSTVIADECGGLIGNLLGVTRENFDNMSYLVVICALSDLVFQLMVVNNKSFCAYFQARKTRRGRRLQRRHNRGLSENNTATLEIPAVSLVDTRERSESPVRTPGTLDYQGESSEIEVDLGGHTPETSDDTGHTLDDPDHMTVNSAQTETLVDLDDMPETGADTPGTQVSVIERFARQVMPPVVAYREVLGSD